MRSVIGREVSAETDRGGEQTTIYAFDLKRFSTDGIVGVGVRYKNFKDPLYGDEVDLTLQDENKVHFGLLLYEMSFPFAEWY